MGRLPRGGSDHQGVHERGDHHRPQVVGRVCSRIFPILRPNQTIQIQADPEDRAPPQQIRGTERLENLTNKKTTKLNCYPFVIFDYI